MRRESRSQGGIVGIIILLFVGEQWRGDGRGVDKVYISLAVPRQPSAGNRLGRRKMLVELWEMCTVVWLSFGAESEKGSEAGSLWANWGSE